VGHLDKVETNQRRFAPTPAHIERNHRPTSLEYAGRNKKDSNIVAKFFLGRFPSRRKTTKNLKGNTTATVC